MPWHACSHSLTGHSRGQKEKCVQAVEAGGARQACASPGVCSCAVPHQSRVWVMLVQQEVHGGVRDHARRMVHFRPRRLHAHTKRTPACTPVCLGGPDALMNGRAFEKGAAGRFADSAGPGCCSWSYDGRGTARTGCSSSAKTLVFPFVHTFLGMCQAHHCQDTQTCPPSTRPLAQATCQARKHGGFAKSFRYRAW